MAIDLDAARIVRGLASGVRMAMPAIAPGLTGQFAADSIAAGLGLVVNLIEQGANPMLEIERINRDLMARLKAESEDRSERELDDLYGPPADDPYGK